MPEVYVDLFNSRIQERASLLKDKNEEYIKQEVDKYNKKIKKINDLKLDFENFYDYCNSELEAKSAKVKLLDKEYKNREMVRKEQLNR